MMKRLGDYIRPVDVRNRDLKVERLLGISVTKEFIPSIANTIGTDMSSYKIVYPKQFVYIADTSRRGDKIAIAYLKENEEPALVSAIYTVFEVVDTNALDPEYLMMWFRRPEFDRYARFHSHGSAREVFDWEEMCEVQVPVPAIEKQREIVAEYNTLATRIETNKKLIATLEQTAQTLYRHTFVDNIDPNNLPDGWRMGIVGDFCEVRDGTHESPKPVEVGNPLVTSAYLLPWRVKLEETYRISRDDFDKINERSLVEKYDILYSMIGTIGAISFVCDDVVEYAVKNMAIFKTSSKKEYAFFLLYFLKSDEMGKILNENMAGSTQSYITLSVLRSIPIVIPSDQDICEFSKSVEPIVKSIIFKDRENQTLTQMQTLLLSKMGV